MTENPLLEPVALAVVTVMGRYRVNSADAFDLLREASDDLGRALLEVADDVIADGHLPEEAIINARRHRTSIQGADAAPSVGPIAARGPAR